MSPRVSTVLGVLALLVVAGCVGPADSGRSTTPTDSLSDTELTESAIEAEESRVVTALENTSRISAFSVAVGDAGATILDRDDSEALVRVEMPVSYTYTCEGATGNVTGVRTEATYQVSESTVSRVAVVHDVSVTCEETTRPSGRHVSPVYHFDSLSRESQEDFLWVMDRGTVHTATQLFGPQIAEERYNLIRIEHAGTIVHIRHQYQPTARRTCLVELEPETESQLGDDATIGQYSDLSPDAKEFFDTVREENTTVCDAPTNYPLREYTHVTYNGTTYALSEMQGHPGTYQYSIAD